MSDDSEGPVVGGVTMTSETDNSQEEHPSPENLWVNLLDWFDEKIYVLVGITFLLAALLSLAYGLLAMGNSVLMQMFFPVGFSLQAIFTKEAGAQDIIALVSDLLLTLIIMEVLGTVVHHLQDGETTLRPFLFIGIISATRGILAVGARLSVSTNGTLTQQEFVRDMVELGVDALVIIALGITMKLIGTYMEQGATPNHRHERVSRRKRALGVQSSSIATDVSRQPAGVGVRAMFAVMVLIILVALALIGVLVTAGHL